LFGDWVPSYWIDQVLTSCTVSPQHTYIFLTKDPWTMRGYLTNLSAESSENWWVGTSLGESRNSWARLPSMQMLGKAGWNTFLSIEPLKEAPLLFSHVSLKGIKQAIIGMQTKPLSPCEPEVIEDVANICKKNNVPIFLKDSTLSCFGRSIVEPTRDLCWEVHK
jgi:protein gp37